MFVRKSQISSIIRKERQKEYDRAIQEKEKALKKTISDLTVKHNNEIKALKKSFDEKLREKQYEIKQLRDEIAKNHGLYQEIRQREIEVDNMSASFETVIDEMNIKVQEALQPFLRMRSKVAAVKRQSDKKDTKIQSIFEAM